MASPINKKSLQHLAELARLELVGREEERLLKDLRKVLEHFAELQAVQTETVLPMTGGTSLSGVFREDSNGGTNLGSGAHSFPELEDEFLKIPPVFE